MLFVQFIYVLVIYVFRPIFSITVEIDGRIDLGHSWQHENPTTMHERYIPLLRTMKTDNIDNEYASIKENDSTTVNAQTFKDNIDFKNDSAAESKIKERRKKSNKKTHVESLDHDNIDLDISSNSKKKKKSISKVGDKKARKVKEDAKINDFIQHIFKQTLKLFDDIKAKSDDKLKYEIASLKRTFKDRFSEYLSETYNHTLRTNLGKRKIILNTIDAAHATLRRLVNNLHKDTGNGALRTDVGAADALRVRVDREKSAEDEHACQRLAICRQRHEFSDFVSDAIAIVLQTDDRKVERAVDALTEALKNADFDKHLNYDLQMKLKRCMGDMERWDDLATRAVFLLIKRLIANRNRPIAVYNHEDSYLANKTVAFQDIIRLMDEKLAKQENVREWEGIKRDLIDWRDDRNKEPLGIAERFVKHTLWTALDKLDYEGKKRLNGAMAVLLSHLSD